MITESHLPAKKVQKAIYSIIEFIIRATEPFSRETRRQLKRRLGKSSGELPLPHPPALHSEKTVFKTWGWGGGQGDVAQLVTSASSGSSGHPSSQSFAPGRQVQPRGRGLGK